MKINKNSAFIWLLLAGVLARVTGALLFSANYSMDHSVPCLMAKHIAEGHSFPVFYYGQPYMGSLESYVGSILYHLPISHNLACNLGTALFGILLLPLIAFWGVKVAGKTGGIAALVCMIIGPPVYMQFMNWSYGGYAAITFFVTSTLLCGLWLLRREQHDGAPIWLWLLTGFTAGLGWWTSPMILPALLLLAYLGLFTLKHRCFQWKTLAAIGAFLLGSLPLWIWNAQNNWATIAFLRADSSQDYAVGMGRYIRFFFYTLLDIHSFGTLTALLLIVFLFLIPSIIIWRQNKPSDSRLYLSAAWLLLLLAMLFFSGKVGRIGPQRYYLPFIPAWAVLFGATVTVLNKKTRLRLGWILLAVIVLLQVRFLPACVHWFGERHALYAELNTMRPYLNTLDTDVIYTEYDHRKYGYGLNFYFDEAFCFVEMPTQERQPLYIQKAEQAEQIAVLNNFQHIQKMIPQTGATVRRIDISNTIWLHDQFVRPKQEYTYLDEPFDITDSTTGDPLTSALTDNNARTGWSNRLGLNNKTLQIDFNTPQQIAMIRFIAAQDRWISTLLIEALYANTEAWEPVAPEYLMNEWFWTDAGNRPYAQGAYYRQEAFVNKKHVRALRLTMDSNDPARYIELSEIQLFSSAPETDLQRAISEIDITTLKDWLTNNQISQVYCDRWTANQLYRRVKNTVPPPFRISLEPLVYGKNKICLPPEITQTQPTALIMRSMNRPLLDRVCSDLALPSNTITLGPWLLYTLHAQAPTASALIWRGFAPQLKVSPEWADLQCNQAADALKRGELQQAEQRIEQTLKAWPNYLSALKIKSQILRHQKRTDQVANIDKQIQFLQKPTIPARIAYKEGITLRGVTLSSIDVHPGDVVTVTYYWMLTKPFELKEYAVFLHLKNEQKKNITTGDSILCDDFLQVIQPSANTYIEQRQLTIPADCPKGIYTLQTGVLPANPPFNRLQPHTSLPVRNKAVVLPVDLSVN